MKKGPMISRRRVLQSATLAAGALGMKALGVSRPASAAPAEAPATGAGTVIGMPFEARPVVRLGLIGYGGRGTEHLNDLLGIAGVEIHAVGDLVKSRVEAAQSIVEKAGQKRPAGYSAGE